jgi:hypothetical protein
MMIVCPARLVGLPIPSRIRRKSLVQPELLATLLVDLPVPLPHDGHFPASPAEPEARSQRAQSTT